MTTILETVDDRQTRVAQQLADARRQQDAITASRAALEARRPSWAKALIVAELEHDDFDSMTDYFNTKTSRVVALAWSAHTRDLFSETRKAAARFPETAHLGPGKDHYTARVVLTSDIPNSNGAAYWKGSYSHWHSELQGQDGQTFTTQAEADAFVAASPKPEDISFDGTIATFAWQITRESIEHREKYSMGHGYYLKASGRYSSGWIVRKVNVGGGYHAVDVSVLDAQKER